MPSESHTESAELLSRDLTGGQEGLRPERQLLVGEWGGEDTETLLSPFHGASLHLIFAPIHLALHGSVSRQNGLCLKLGVWGRRSLGKCNSVCMYSKQCARLICCVSTLALPVPRPPVIASSQGLGAFLMCTVHD